MPHTSTTIYVDTSTTPPKGISPADVSAVLHRHCGDYGALCGDMKMDVTLQQMVRANAINKWNANKPVRADLRKIMTAADFADCDYGFDILSQQNGIIARGGSGAIASLMTRAINNGGDWVYLPPRGRNYDGYNHNEWFRIRDFDGYHIGAQAPYYPVSRGLSGDTSILPSSINVVKVYDSEILLDQMHSVRQLDIEYDPDEFYLGVITRKAGVTKLWINSNVTLQDILDEESATADNTEWSVPVTFDTSDGETVCLFVLTTINQFDSPGVIDDSAGSIDDMITIWLPDCMARYMVSSVSNTILLAPGQDYLFTLLTDASGDSLQALVPQVYLTNANSGGAQSVYVEVTMQYYDSSGDTWVNIGTSTATRNIPVGGTLNLTMPSIAMPSEIQEAENWPLEYLRAKVMWRWTHNYTTHTHYFDFEHGYPVSSDLGFWPLDDIESYGYTIQRRTT